MAEIIPATVLPLNGAAVSICATDGHVVRGVLSDVTAVHRTGQPGAPDTEQISLLVAANNNDLAAGTYHLQTDHLDLGKLSFMPVGRAGRERRLEAVITRIV